MNVLRFAFRTALAVFVCTALPSLAAAQLSGGTGGRSIGGSFSPRSGTAFGSGAGVGAGGALGGTVAGLTTQGDATTGSVTGAERFVRNNRQPGAFVGSDTSDLNSFFTSFGTGGGGMGALQILGDAFNQVNRSGTATQRPFRTTFRVAFDTPQPVSGEVSPMLTQRLASIAAIRTIAPINVVVEGRTAVLSGTVLSDHDRELAERVVLLEPGVDAVRNDLVVSPPASE